jgi:hypothetical protein
MIGKQGVDCLALQEKKTASACEVFSQKTVTDGKNVAYL